MAAFFLPDKIAGRRIIKSVSSADLPILPRTDIQRRPHSHTGYSSGPA